METDNSNVAIKCEEEKRADLKDYNKVQEWDINLVNKILKDYPKNMQNSNWLEPLRDECKKDFFFFIKTVLKPVAGVPGKNKFELSDAKHFKAMQCLWNADMEGFYKLGLSQFGTLKLSKNKRHNKRVHLLPRIHGKTQVGTVAWLMWRLFKDPDLRILLMSQTWDNARAMLKLIKDYYIAVRETRLNPLNATPYWVLGDCVGGLWNEDQILLKTRRTLDKTPSILTAGIEKEITSQHFDIVKADDLIGDKNTQTLGQIEKTKRAIYALTEVGDYFLEIHTEYDFNGTIWHYNDWYAADVLRKLKDFYDVLVMRCWDKEDHIPLFPEKYTTQSLEDIKKEKLTGDNPLEWNCLPKNAPIWMADGTFIDICNIQVGDEVMGYEGRTLKRAKILFTKSRIAEVQEVILKSGRKIICTPDHKWDVRRSISDGHNRYLPAKVGRNLQHVIEPADWDIYFDNSEWRYLAGLIDGEGSCTCSQIQIWQSPTKNPDVYGAIEAVLMQLGLNFKLYHRKPYTKNGVVHSASVGFTILGGRQPKIDIINYGEPAKSKQIMKSIMDRPSKMVDFEDEIVSIKPVGETTVYSIQTDTGNYIAYGYASKNCQWLNEPADEGTAIFKQGMLQYYDFKELPKHMTIGIFTDPALSAEKWSCYTAIVPIGIDKYGRRYVLPYLRIKEKDPDMIAKAIARMAVQYYKPGMEEGLAYVGVEEGREYNAMENKLRAYEWLPLGKLKIQGRSKDGRIFSLQPLLMNKQLFIHRSMVELKEQFLTFPRMAERDVLDAVAYHMDIFPMWDKEPPEKQERFMDFSQRMWASVRRADNLRR